MRSVQFSRLRRTVLAFAFALSGLPLLPNAAAAPTAAPSPAITGVDIGKVRWGYYVPYAANSLESLKENIGTLSHLSPYWYTIDGEGNLGVSGNEVRDPNLWDPLESTCRHASLSIL